MLLFLFYEVIFMEKGHSYINDIPAGFCFLLVFVLLLFLGPYRMGAFAAALALAECLHGGRLEKKTAVSCLCPAAATIIPVVFVGHIYIGGKKDFFCFFLSSFYTSL